MSLVRDDDAEHPRTGDWRGSPLVWGAGCWMVGLILGREMGGGTAWLIAAGVCLAAAAIVLRRGMLHVTIVLAGVGIVAIAAAWWDVRVRSASFAFDAGEASRLVDVEGVIEGEVYQRLQARGEMGRFDYRSPKTMFVMRMERCFSEPASPEARPASGGVIVDLPAYDGRLKAGDRVRCRGWLTPLKGPMNPGERDFRGMMADQGTTARLSLKDRANCTLVERANESVVTAWQERLQRAAQSSLHLGMDRAESNTTAALLDALLLGDRRGDLGELDGAFRRTGLAHLLAISGMHLAILVAGAWWAARLFGARPRFAAAAALLTVAVYLLIIPGAVPVLRAGIMTAAACVALSWGRRISAMAALALAAIVLLMWRPGDLFSAGFQLSFVVVAGLVAFTRGVSDWLYARPLIDDGATFRGRVRRIAADYLAVTIVAWCVSMPLIAYHFQIVSPLSGLMTLAMLPVMAVLLWIGYLKVVLGLMMPWAGEALGPVVWELGEWTAASVAWMGQWRGVAIGMPGVSVLWVTAALATGAAWMAGRFHQRRRALTAAVLIVLMWAAAPVIIAQTPLDQPALRINMFAVGDGSCFLLRSGGEAMIFDCGSSSYLDITTATIEPALRELGVLSVQTLIVSHADTDHFSGSLELIERFGVRRLITTQAFLDEAETKTYSAAAHLITGAKRRGVEIMTVQRGDAWRFGETNVAVLWPPDHREFERSNDGSTVLRLIAGGRRVMLCGDVQQEAMTAMLKADMDIAADVVELPHHGSMVDAAPAWIERVAPGIVLQSSGPARLIEDKWAWLLADTERHITARHGMVELTIAADGQILAQRTVQAPPEAPGK